MVDGPVFQEIKWQEIVSRGEGKPGVPGPKAALQRFFWVRGYARRHFRRVGDAEVESLAEKMKEVMDIDDEL